MALSSDFQKLSVENGIVMLYELDATNVGAGVFYFHGHTSREDWHRILQYAGDTNDYAGDTDRWAGDVYDDDADPDAREYTLKRDIIYMGKVYKPIAIKSSGLEVRGDGRASSPTLLIANELNGVPGMISAYCLRHDDFCRAKLTIIMTSAAHLDEENFIEGNPRASTEHEKQIWYIEQKKDESAEGVVFELSNPVDLEGVKIPTRDITSYCAWAVRGGYRGENCGYTGAKMFDINGDLTDDPAKDNCGGPLSHCMLRFGEHNPLPFGGFPASSLINR